MTNLTIPANWRRSLSGAINSFTPDPPLPGIERVKCDVSQGTGQTYRWGITVDCENGETVTTRGPGSRDIDVAIARCEAAWPSVACFAASRATVTYSEGA